MSDGELLILGAILALGGAVLLKLEMLLHPDGGNEFEGFACALIYIAGAILSFVAILRLF